MSSFDPLNQVPIPGDVEPDAWTSMILCVPADGEWLSAVRGALGSLARGRYWLADGRQGSIRAAQAVARRIGESIMICDLDARLADIAAAIRESSVSVSVSSVCCETVVPPAPEPAVDPDEWPLPGSGSEPPAWPNPGTYDAAACDAINGVLWAYRQFAAFLANLDLLSAVAVLIVSGLAALFPEPVTTAIGTFTFVSIAGAIIRYGVGISVIADGAEIARDAIDDYRQELVCDALVGKANLHALVSDVASRLATILFTSIHGAGVDMDTAARLSGWVGDLDKFAAHVIDGLASVSAKLYQPPIHWRVDCAGCSSPVLIPGEFVTGFESFAQARCNWYADYGGIVRLTNGASAAQLIVSGATRDANGIPYGVLSAGASVEVELWRGGDDSSEASDYVRLMARRASDGAEVEVARVYNLDLPGKFDVPPESGMALEWFVPFDVEFNNTNSAVKLVWLETGGSTAVRHVRTARCTLRGVVVPS